MENLPLEQLVKAIAGRVALGIELIAVACVVVGVVRSLPLIFTGAGRAAAPPFSGGVFARLARWLVLALEFALAADIVRTAIEPTWKDIGMLASIAVIRTFLNFFLMRDLEKVLARKELAESG
jgi:uncharacterized membrane protein